jgi:hypothetical protein
MRNSIKPKKGENVMLRKMGELKGFAIGARDGDIGEANDFIFDDKNWTVRH